MTFLAAFGNRSNGSNRQSVFIEKYPAAIVIAVPTIAASKGDKKCPIPKTMPTNGMNTSASFLFGPDHAKSVSRLTMKNTMVPFTT